MTDGGNISAGAALGNAIAGNASGQAPTVLAAKVARANKKADKLGAEKDTPCKDCGCSAKR